MKRLHYQIFQLRESIDKEGKEWEVVLIQAGKSLNNKFYPADVLKKRVNLFENAKAFAYEFNGKLFNHLPDIAKRLLPEGFIKNLVGWYDNCRFETFVDAEGKTQEGILGRFHVTENAKWLRDLLKDAWDHGKKSLLGLSIDGDGKVTEKNVNGSKTFMVEDIHQIDSIDPVTYPAAGGQLVRLLASISFEEEKQMDFLKKLYAMAKKFNESLIEGIDVEKITPEQEISLLKALIEGKAVSIKEDMFTMLDRLIELISTDKKDEALKLIADLKTQISENKPAPAAPAAPPAPAPAAPAPAPAAPAPAPAAPAPAAPVKASEDPEIIKQKKELAEIVENAKKMQSESVLNKMLSESKIFDVVKDKIRKQFAGKIFEAKELETVLVEEAAVLAKLSESGNVSGLGGTKIEVQADEVDKLHSHLDLLIDPEAEVPAKLKESVGTKSAFRGIRAAYIAFNPDDPDITFARQRKIRLTENIITTDFSYALSVSMTKRAGKEYVKIPFIFDSIVNKVPLDSFKQQEYIQWGGYSTLPTVAQRGSYTDLMQPSDSRATYTPGKKGGLIYVTRETIMNDDMRYINKIPGKVTSAAARTLQRFISDLLVSNGTYGPGGTAIFTVAYGNYSTQTLSYDNLTARKVAMKKRRERGTIRTSGTATAATSTTLSDTSNATILDDVYNTYYIRIVYGTGAGQTRLISDTATSGSTITVSAAWTTNPSTDSLYEVTMATNDDEKVGIMPKNIIFGDATEAKVDSLLDSPFDPSSAASNEVNVHKGKYSRIYVPFLDGTSQYYWFLAADKSQCDMIEMGFINGKEKPELLLQDQPTVGNNFSADEITYKVRHEFGGAVVDNIGLDGNFATGV